MDSSDACALHLHFLRIVIYEPYMRSPVEKIKERLTIVDVVSSYIKLDKAGINHRALCPFHNEKTPSFFVSPERDHYFCFGCSAKGDIFTFVQEFEGLDFKGALKTLADKAGVELTKIDPKVKDEMDRLYTILEDTTKFFEQSLEQHKEVKEYLRGRGITDETIKEFRIGYIPNEWSNLSTHLKNASFTDSDIEKVGLIIKAPSDSTSEVRYYDRFRGRIMFPIMDSSGRVIAFSGRIFKDDEKSAKYLNSPDTVLFNKSAVLYGIDKAKSHIRKQNFSILVEGQFDLVLSHQIGFKNTVALSGTALADTLTLKDENKFNNLGQIKALSKNLIIAFDSDTAGIQAAGRAAKIALSFGMDVKITSLPEGMDPADYIQTHGTKWQDILKNSKYVIDFYLDEILASSSDSRVQGRAIREKVLPFVALLESSMDQSHFIKKIAEKTNNKEDVIWQDFNSLSQTTTSSIINRQDKETGSRIAKGKRSPAKDSVLRKLVGILVWQETKNNNDITVKLKDSLHSIVGDEMFEKIKALDKEKKDELIFETEVFYEDSGGVEDTVEELLLNLEEEYLKKELDILMKDLNKAEKENNHTQASEILIKCQELTGEIHTLKNRRIEQL
ncbi:DNA primase [Candidatus Wolfebacteria bacterium]|nr:MAG: DNA primase [Candidatus Wolfebacteria bacterium]